MAKFEEVADVIQQRIQDNTYSPAQKLPSEYQLATDFKVSRLTVRKAIQRLIEKKELIKDPGKGTYVMTAMPEAKIQSGVGGLQSFTEVARLHGKTPHAKVLDYYFLDHPSEQIVHKLKLHDRLNQKVHFLRRLRYWDRTPLTLEEIVISDDYVQGLTKEDFEHSFFSILEKRINIAYSHQVIEAVLVNQELSKLLQVKVGQPLLKEKSIVYSADSQPIYLDTSYYRADKYSFDATLTRNL